MSWARIMAPLSGGQGDAAAVAAAAMLAEPFGAELAGVYTPADVADVMPWMGEGFLGGVQTTALESLKEAAAAGESERPRGRATAAATPRRSSSPCRPPVWAGLSAESRLSDVVVFTSDPARGRGPLAEAFQQMVADEQRPVLVAREGLKVGGAVAVAWDGGKEASRAARLALPLLEKAEQVVIVAAPKASSRSFDPDAPAGLLRRPRREGRGRAADATAATRRRRCCMPRRRPAPTSWWPAPSAIRACRSSSSAARRGRC